MTTNTQNFLEYIQQGYTFKTSFATLGTAIFEGIPVHNALVNIPLRAFNRHGLIAGATGTGKTKTIQLLTELLSENGVPVLAMDIKGDLSGLAAEGIANPKIEERHQKIGIPYQTHAFPAELLSISGQKGVKLRATVSEFGPVLFSKMLELNETQAGIVSAIFKFCDDNNLPLLDLKDFKKVLNYVGNEGKAEIEEQYGTLSASSVGLVLRKVVELEQQGADTFFGEPSFDINDLLRINDCENEGVISILRVTDLQDRPKLYSTFMLCLLAELYQTLPEAGDLEKPKLVIFIDEAHLIFNEATDALLNQIETIIKLIRSKGVGVFFCTQIPSDVPDAVLSQLGTKIQHALRAFTAKDRKSIKLTAENYPLTDFYDTEQMLTALGIGEAAFTTLDEKGRPTPFAAVYLRAPRSRMDVLTNTEIEDLVNNSEIAQHYNKTIDRQSAYEMLTAKLNEATNTPPPPTETKTSKKQKEEPTIIETITNNKMAKQIGNTLVKELTRGLLGVLGLGGRRR